MDIAALEGIAAHAYATAGLDATKGHVPRLARALLGPCAIVRGSRPFVGPAALTRDGDVWTIVIARALTPAQALDAVAHELAHWLLIRHGLAGSDNEEQAADYLAAALLGAPITRRGSSCPPPNSAKAARPGEP